MNVLMIEYCELGDLRNWLREGRSDSPKMCNFIDFNMVGGFTQICKDYKLYMEQIMFIWISQQEI